MNNKSTHSVILNQYNDNSFQQVNDVLAVEEPLEIKINYKSESTFKETNISITMRTPGNDSELAVGFLFTEGIVSSLSQIKKISHDGENKITVFLNDAVLFDKNKIERNFYTTSSCGVCGKASIDSIKTVSQFPIENQFPIDSDIILKLPEILSQQQQIFKTTGGLHASALFKLNGDYIDLQEDVGRHNALDKLIGTAFLKENIPLRENILLLSGRASFELIQKAGMAGIPIVAAIGAPSSLAVELARELKIQLIGFLKKDKFNLY